MKKVATITFHWSANYGAVLQTYALHKYLLGQGLQTEVIDSLPSMRNICVATDP